MQSEHWTTPLSIIGLELRTDNNQAFQTIPLHWKQFMETQVLEQIPHKLSSDLYAIYTLYTNAGVNNLDTYSFVIGAASSAEAAPGGLTCLELPASHYQVVSVEHGRPDLVGQAWQEIWAQDASRRTFVADFERYRSDGSIDILLGVRMP